MNSIIATNEFVNQVELAKFGAPNSFVLKTYLEKAFEESHNETTWHWMGIRGSNAVTVGVAAESVVMDKTRSKENLSQHVLGTQNMTISVQQYI